jgi:hypothetical protein
MTYDLKTEKFNIKTKIQCRFHTRGGVVTEQNRQELEREGLVHHYFDSIETYLDYFIHMYRFYGALITTFRDQILDILGRMPNQNHL